MAFQANILGLQSNLPAGCTLAGIDNTNYDLNPTPRFSRSKFNNTFIFIIRPDLSEYIFGSSALNAFDEAMDSPADVTGPQQITYNFLPTDVNGVYTIELVTLPTYDALESYEPNEFVVFNGQIWKNTLVTNPLSPSVPNGWTLEVMASLRSTSYTVTSLGTVTIDCLQSSYYQTSMYDVATDQELIDVTASCSAIDFTDNSNWSENSEEGHALSDFSNYRRITLTRPDTGTYVYFTVAGTGIDEVIAAAASGNQDFTYPFLSTDIDGRYQVKICEYPTWGDGYNYSADRFTVVYYDGVLYKAIQNNVGSQPDITPSDWAVYAPTAEEEEITRYCYTANIAVLCIGLNKCMEEKNHQAICGIQKDFCNKDILCKNPDFLDYTILRTLRDGVEYSMNRQMWNEVDAEFNLMRLICNC
jgi:hypothetical protein